MEKGSYQKIEAVAFANSLIADAYEGHASDIHIDPLRNCVLVRMRRDGELSEYCRYDIASHLEMVSRIKIMAGLRLDEHFLPQDGRITLESPLEGEVRVVAVPCCFGEALTLRLLRSHAGAISLESLGYSEEHAKWLSQAVSKGSGLYIIAGPTGSGKTTTLYALISLILSGSRSIITVEDPVEYIFPGVRQIPIGRNEQFSFADGLRSILRQDPDVIVVGEIRDAATAKTAVSAALTGHKVFATIHTASASAIPKRLCDMGVESYMVRETLQVAVSQRLVRKVCQKCRVSCPLNPDEILFVEKNLEKTFLPQDCARITDDTAENDVLEKTFTISKAAGCDFCAHKGYEGRQAIYEIVSEHFSSPPQITDGISKALSGEVFLEDVMALFV